MTVGGRAIKYHTISTAAKTISQPVFTTPLNSTLTNLPSCLE